MCDPRVSIRYDRGISGEKDGGRDSADSLYKFSNQSTGKPDAKIAEKRTAGVEASRGEFGVYLESRGDKYPYRVKFRSPCLPLVSIVDLITKGGKIADLIAIGGTLDYVVPDIDR